MMLDDALLLVTELVTNSVVHAGTQIELHVDLGPDCVRLEVIDRRPGALPEVCDEPDKTSEGGRGIFLLDALAQEWGTRHFPGGKAVWFRLDVSDRVAPRLLPQQLPWPGAPPSPPVISWLLGLPTDMEEWLGPKQLLSELLYRLCGAMDLQHGWLLAESELDGGHWSVVTAHDRDEPAPPVDDVHRLAFAGADHLWFREDRLLLLPLRRGTGVLGALVVGGADGPDAGAVAMLRLVADRMAVVLRDDRAHAAQQRDREALALLAEASELFAGTLDVTLAVTLAAQLVVPHFATWSGVYMVDDHGVHLAAVAHALEKELPLLREGLIGPTALALVQRVARGLGDHPALVSAHELPRALQVTGGEVLAVPLVARRRLLGVMLVGRSFRSSQQSDDVGLLLDLASIRGPGSDRPRVDQLKVPSGSEESGLLRS
jgi:sigma-B regulation protein RsbU (phosphoserine phosphatase)